MSHPTPYLPLAAGLFALLALLATPAGPVHADPRNVEAVIAALGSPIAPAVAEEARAFDARLLASGEFDGVHVRVVTDQRLARVSGVAVRLLRSAGKDSADWTVRVLETDPMLINACVSGGRYVYVFTGLLAQDPGADELAFILAHELGHSLLAHEERLGKNAATSTAAVAGLSALHPAGHEMNPIGGEPPVIASAFSREDEQEADALGTCIARRAGFDPLRGADYFTRIKRDYETRESDRAGRLAQARREVDQAVAACEKGQEQLKNATGDVSRIDRGLMISSCSEVQSKQESYYHLAVAYSTGRSLERRIVLLTAHPQESSRMAAIAGVVDVLGGRKDVGALAGHEPARRVLAALQQTGSGLVGATAAAHD